VVTAIRFQALIVTMTASSAAISAGLNSAAAARPP